MKRKDEEKNTALKAPPLGSKPPITDQHPSSLLPLPTAQPISCCPTSQSNNKESVSLQPRSTFSSFSSSSLPLFAISPLLSVLPPSSFLPPSPLPYIPSTFTLHSFLPSPFLPFSSFTSLSSPPLYFFV